MKKVSTLDNKKGFINLHFLQKINCQKTDSLAWYNGLTTDQYILQKNNTLDYRPEQTTVKDTLPIEPGARCALLLSLGNVCDLCTAAIVHSDLCPLFPVYLASAPSPLSAMMSICFPHCHLSTFLPHL